MSHAFYAAECAIKFLVYQAQILGPSTLAVRELGAIDMSESGPKGAAISIG